VRLEAVGAAIVSVVAIGGCARDSGARAAVGTAVITGVAVVPMDGQGVLPDRTVVVRDGRIEAIYEPGQAPGIRAETQLDGSGKFLAPGLIDAHAHVRLRSDLERYLVHGVTSVRDMWGLPRTLRWREAIRDGSIAGPNLVVASTYFWLDGPAATRHVEPTSPDTARALVRQAAREGYDLIKVVSLRDLATLRAIVDEARQLGLTVSGHYPDKAVPVAEMLEVGMASFEHADEFASVAFATDTSEAAIRRLARALVERRIGLTTILTPAEQYRAIDRQGADYYSTDARIAVLERLGAYYYQDAVTTIDNVLAARGRYVKQWTEGSALAHKAARTFVEEGVRLGIGTEGIGAFYGVDGVGVHDEMSLLSKAGLTNRQVLEVATVNGAALLGFEGRKGRLRVGFDADLLLLDADPLESLETLQHPEAVFVRGRCYSPVELAALKRVY